MVLYTLFGVPEMMDTPPIIDKSKKEYKKYSFSQL